MGEYILKKSTLYTVLNIVLALLFVGFMLLQHFFALIGGVSLSQFWFPCVLLLLGISLFTKSIIFNSDSTFWFALVVFFVFAFMIFAYFIGISYSKFWPVFIAIPALASLIVGLAYKQWFQIKICLFLISVFIPVMLLTLKLVTIWWFILVILLSISGGLYMISLLPERFIMNRRKKDE